jgi:aspartate aminotransferase
MKESATLAVGARVAALRASGVDVVGFAMGEPDFDTPLNIKRAAIRALEAGMTKYAPTPGDRAAREAIAQKLRRENGIQCAAEHVTVTVGAKHAIYMALQAMIEPGRGDEFLLPTPAWVSYRPLIELAGGVCVEVPGEIDNGFAVTAEQVESAITPRTVGILLNSPSNPCGVVVPPARLRAIVDVIARHPRITILSDEIYEKLVFPEITPDAIHWSPGSDPRVADRTVTVNGMSKAFAMTGWRIGYLCAPGGSFAKEIIKLQGQMTNSIPSFFFPAVVEALSTESAAQVERMRAAFAARAQLIHARLSAVPGVRATQPTGAFYSFPDISELVGTRTVKGVPIRSAQSFADALLDESHVAVVPGEDFGECARTNIRLSFACAEEQITKGLDRIDAFVRSLKPERSTAVAASLR